MATGSPFPPVKNHQNGKLYKVAESNNALVYPGFGLGCALVATPYLRLTH